MRCKINLLLIFLFINCSQDTEKGNQELYGNFDRWEMTPEQCDNLKQNRHVSGVSNTQTNYIDFIDQFAFNLQQEGSLIHITLEQLNDENCWAHTGLYLDRIDADNRDTFFLRNENARTVLWNWDAFYNSYGTLNPGFRNWILIDNFSQDSVVTGTFELSLIRNHIETRPILFNEPDTLFYYQGSFTAPRRTYF